MQPVVVLGSGGCAKEILWLLEDNNQHRLEWNILGLVDDAPQIREIHGYPVLGDDQWLMEYPTSICAVCGLGFSKARRRIIQKYRQSKSNVIFPPIVSAHAHVSPWVILGEGCVVCSGSILSTDVMVGNFVTINQNCTIGHDSVLQDFVTVSPGVCVSGNVRVGEGVEIGTGAQIIQGKTIGAGSVVGAGSVIIRDLESECTAVGNPGRILMK